VDLSVSRWQSDGHDVLYVSDARTEQEVGRYDQRAGRLAVGDQTRVYEVVQALWAFLGSVAGAAEETQGRVDEPRSAGWSRPDIDGHLLGLRTASPVREAAAKARNGRIVDRRLGRLRRDGWAVLPSVGERTGADFDRLVIGPPGVFAITVKRGGDVPLPYLTDSLHDSRQDARSAAHRLSAACGMTVTVTPMLAFIGDGEGGDGESGGRESGGGSGGDVGGDRKSAVDGYSVHGSEDPAEVLVARGEYLDEVLRDLPAVYSLQERQQILDVARRAELWLDSGYPGY
jgi:hypothetical protein